MEESGLYRLNFPSRIYLETTTRCNLSCEMCVKQSDGGVIAEGDFDPAMIASIDPALPRVKSLILNGIGEPMLYPDLEKIISRASARMSPDSYIGFQTNGMLVSSERTRSLIDAGLNLVCVSMDASAPDEFRMIRKGGEVTEAENSIRVFREESLALNKRTRIGVEFVLSRDNIHQLIPVLRNAAEHGAGFAIVTHLIPYSERMVSMTAYDRNTDMAVELYERTLEKTRASGIDITKYFDIRWKFNHTPEEERILKAVDEMTEEARRSGIFLNVQSVMNSDSAAGKEIEAVFHAAVCEAEKLGIELSLPASVPSASRRCDFIESGSVFISWDGDVHPCHFLWHKFHSYISGWKKYVSPVSFGNLKDNDIINIWNSAEFVKFRDSVSGYDYPLCSNCGLAPCDYIYSETFEQDCYTNTIPCCDCQWCLGLFQCLR